jgi:hypothetical protein
VTGLSISDTTLQFEASGSATEFGVLGFRRRGANEIICISYINTATKLRTKKTGMVLGLGIICGEKEIIKLWKFSHGLRFLAAVIQTVSVKWMCLIHWTFA